MSIIATTLYDVSLSKVLLISQNDLEDFFFFFRGFSVKIEIGKMLEKMQIRGVFPRIETSNRKFHVFQGTK